MPTAVHAVIFVVCLVVLAKIADVIVDAVLAIAHHYRIPPTIAGATLAAAATSAPELGTNFFALLSARAGDGEVAASIGLGSIFGSAVFNLTVIVALVGLFGDGQLTRRMVLRDNLAYIVSIVATLTFVSFLGTPDNALGRYEGMICVAIYLVYALVLARDRLSQIGLEKEADGVGSGSRPFVKLIVSIALIAVACHFLVDSTRHLATVVADALDLDPAAAASFISLVVVAAATSVPDALTSVAAARRGHSGLAVGNAVGSNTFDMLICTGLPAAIFGGYTANDLVVISGVCLLATALILPVLLFRGWRVSRSAAVILLACYAAFVAVVGVMPML